MSEKTKTIADLVGDVQVASALRARLKKAWLGLVEAGYAAENAYLEAKYAQQAAQAALVKAAGGDDGGLSYDY